MLNAYKASLNLRKRLKMNRLKKISEMKYFSKGMNFSMIQSLPTVSYFSVRPDGEKLLVKVLKGLCGALAFVFLLAFIPYYKLVTKRLIKKVSKHYEAKNNDMVQNDRLTSGFSRFSKAGYSMISKI